MGEDERQLADLGYKQELTRAWSGFTNFAISFTIISVLAGCFTNFGFAWTAGGPIGISIGCTLVNIFADRLLAIFNDVSVGWHVLGVLAIILLLALVPSHHQDAGVVFGHTFNNTGFHGGHTSGAFFWLYILPIGFILTMYTQTGYDASAHTAEETRGAALGAARGGWRSVFYSAIAGWAVLLALVFAASNVPAITEKGGGSIPIIETSLTSAAAKAVLLIATVGQLFCGAAGLTSCSRTWYAFSRDRGMPGWALFRRLNVQRVPLYAVLASSIAALIITIPAYFGNKAGIPWAYFAITAICTVGLYLAYIIPVYLRLRMGDRFEAGPWTLGRHYKWINGGAIAFVVLVVYALDIPIVPAGVPWNSGFDWTSVNYSPLVLVIGVLVGIWWV